MKQFKTHEIRNLLDQVTRGDISFSRMVELINEEIDKHSVSMVDRDVDYEKEMPHKKWPSTKYVARKVDAESHDRHISGTKTYNYTVSQLDKFRGMPEYFEEGAIVNVTNNFTRKVTTYKVETKKVFTKISKDWTD